MVHHNVASGAVPVLALGYTGWAQNDFKQPPVHRIFFDAYGKAWQRRSGGRRTRALQSVRVQSNQYLEILNDVSLSP